MLVRLRGCLHEVSFGLLGHNLELAFRTADTDGAAIRTKSKNNVALSHRALPELISLGLFDVDLFAQAVSPNIIRSSSSAFLDCRSTDIAAGSNVHFPLPRLMSDHGLSR